MRVYPSANLFGPGISTLTTGLHLYLPPHLIGFSCLAVHRSDFLSIFLYALLLCCFTSFVYKIVPHITDPYLSILQLTRFKPSFSLLLCVFYLFASVLYFVTFCWSRLKPVSFSLIFAIILI